MAAVLQLTLLHQAGFGPLEALEQQVPDSVVEGFRPEAPLAEIHVALESFHRGVWAKHGRSMTLLYMASQGTLGASGGLHPGSSLGGSPLHPEPTGAPQPSVGPSSGEVAPSEPCMDSPEV